MAVVITAGAVDLDREGRDPAYVESIVKRSQKIVDKLELTDTVAAREVTTIIANRYFKLNDIYETRDAKVKLAKETLTGDAKQEAVKAAEAEKDAALYRTHFAFPADLSLYLDAKQIDAVKDGVVIGIRTPLDAGGDIKLLKEINSKGIKIYYSFQNALENGRDLCKELKKLGKDRICQIHCTDTDGVTLPYNTRLDMNAVKHILDKMGWSGWLVIERSRNKDEVRNVKKNFGTNVAYLKQVFQQEK
ncbi:hypothetical protein VIC01_02640 [Phocaeicola vulgatus]|uniref:Xylose isomerase-like TIM barrel domain-containing protein n=3 Tax=Phocaeicola TaxID=909656 RepID=A0A5P3ATR8_PHOVU|nr:hypothetical protein VIC01_02636 [Phocaeicola vulgatus]QEW37067.1 hypothetical protein VIC01_02640 [Phocaeicola vulgatus]